MKFEFIKSIDTYSKLPLRIGIGDSISCQRLFLQHPDLTVTSEERVLNAILLWCCKAEELFGWDSVDEMMLNLAPELVFGERLNSLEEFLSFVRFPLLPYSVLQKVYPESVCFNF